jgi:hypothetical protein
MSYANRLAYQFSANNSPSESGPGKVFASGLCTIQTEPGISNKTPTNAFQQQNENMIKIKTKKQHRPKNT